MRGSVLRLVPALLVTFTVTAGAASSDATDRVAEDAAVRAARRSVEAVFGADAEVRLDAPVVVLGRQAVPVAYAEPEPGSRTGKPVRFVLYGVVDGRPVRVGRLSATLRVHAPHVRLRDERAANTTLDETALETLMADIGTQPLRPLPTRAQLAGATTRRALAAGTVVSAHVVRTRPVVVVRDEVATIARVEGLEIRSRAVATQSGELGDVIWVVNPDSRKRLRARVVGPGLVEVGHGS